MALSLKSVTLPIISLRALSDSSSFEVTFRSFTTSGWIRFSPTALSSLVNTSFQVHLRAELMYDVVILKIIYLKS